MLSIETFAVIGGDLRFSYLAGQLADDGYRVIAVGLEHADLPPGVTGCSRLSQAIDLSDCLILPVPVSTDGHHVNAPLSKLALPLDALYRTVRRGQVVIGGGLRAEIAAALRERDAIAIDVLKREELAVQNAIPTAEGAVALAMEELSITLHGARCLVTGYGRVARVLSRLLAAFGSEVTVAARRCSDRAWATVDGGRAEDLTRLRQPLDFDVIFNTVPHLLFDRDVLTHIDPHTLLIDLASRPGGVDFNAASELHIKTVWALSLPGRVAPKTAAGILRDAILNAIREVTP
ncbi:MAG: dipicolinate synthase subunit DpsA [Clostridia bacterium]|nr:dipicolinate synthase subunit DpsA [Clostridia bacterium]